MVHPFKILEFEGDYRNNKFDGQRKGQAFCNYFNIADNALFYETDDKKAQNYYWQHYAQ